VPPLGQLECGCYRSSRVSRPDDAAEAEGQYLIAHDFGNRAVVGNDRIGCQSIEAVLECVEVAQAHAFCYCCRAADIGEQQGDRDLNPSHLTFA